ncbi:MAG TPA: hypothetical protein VMP11_18960 [Verrucomicrobiae bacterium]|nr:hypothetical protein [Verrucomicrobiae bacterium]
MERKPYYSTEFGEAYLGDSLEFMRELPNDCVNLVLTSPPFALTRKKAYGNAADDEYVSWLVPFATDTNRIHS